MNYETETRLFYQDTRRAQDYKRHHASDFSWARFATRRKLQCVTKALRECNLSEHQKVLDFPCGTGVLGSVLSKFPSSVVAADISREMMALADEEYAGWTFRGFVQADSTKPPFRDTPFACVITLGLVHRLPPDIRQKVIAEISHLSNRFVIISCSIESLWQRVKKRIIKCLWRTYRPAPSPAPLRDMIQEFRAHGLGVRKVFRVVWFLSSHVAFLLEKRAPALCNPSSVSLPPQSGHHRKRMKP